MRVETNQKPRSSDVRPETLGYLRSNLLGCISSAGTPLEEALKEIAPYDPMDAASDEVKSVFREAERNYQDMVEKVKQESKKLDELKKTRTEIEEEIKARTVAAATSFLNSIRKLCPV